MVFEIGDESDMGNVGSPVVNLRFSKSDDTGAFLKNDQPLGSKQDPHGTCSIQGSLFLPGDSRCKLPNTALVGIERDDVNNLSGIRLALCCQLPPASISTQDFSIR